MPSSYCKCRGRLNRSDHHSVPIMYPRLSGSGVGVTPHAARQQHSNNMALQVAAAAASFGSVPFGGRPSYKSKRPLHFLTRLILPSIQFICSIPTLSPCSKSEEQSLEEGPFVAPAQWRGEGIRSYLASCQVWISPPRVPPTTARAPRRGL
jgi:hypothetical protein